MTQTSVRLEPVDFSDLPNWQDDDHAHAFQAFVASSERLLEQAQTSGAGYLGKPTPEALMRCAAAAVAQNKALSRSDARKFFETYFHPHKIADGAEPGLLTGYYEPVLDASRSCSDSYPVPLLRRPENLINLVSDADRGQFGDQLTHALETDGDTVPCPTRSEIEQGALETRSLAFAWLRCPVDAFFLHVEGSGLLKFEDGCSQRVTYDGKNGHPYTSVGQHLIETGVFEKGTLTFQGLKDWLKADIQRARSVLWQNKSYIFFRELRSDEPDSALGVLQIPLVPGRSLAVDTTYHNMGSPIFVTAPDLEVDGVPDGYARLMVAHDVGSAIRGPERGDIFFGSGEDAGRRAGLTVHRGTFYVLKPKSG